MSGEGKERLQKILAKAGIASRRKAEELISEGLVTINGRVAQLGDKAEMGRDAIKVKGKLIHTLEPPVYLAFNKPKGVISMLADPEGRATLKDFLSKVKARVFPIGRLDFNSEGLILLTNDGAFAQALQQRENIPRVYQAKVKGHPEPEALGRLERGMRMGNRHIRPHSTRLLEDLANKSKIELVFLDSGAIDVKTLLETKGFLVERIVRTAIGHITLHGLLPGHFRFLKNTQVQALLDQPELGMRRLELEHEKAKPVRRDEPRADEEKRPQRGPRPLRGSPERGPRIIRGPQTDRGERNARRDFERGPKRGFQNFKGPKGEPKAPRSGFQEKRGPKPGAPRGEFRGPRSGPRDFSRGGDGRTGGRGGRPARGRR